MGATRLISCLLLCGVFQSKFMAESQTTTTKLTASSGDVSSSSSPLTSSHEPVLTTATTAHSMASTMSSETPKGISTTVAISTPSSESHNSTTTSSTTSTITNSFSSTSSSANNSSTSTSNSTSNSTSHSNSMATSERQVTTSSVTASSASLGAATVTEQMNVTTSQLNPNSSSSSYSVTSSSAFSAFSSTSTSSSSISQNATINYDNFTSSYQDSSSMPTVSNSSSGVASVTTMPVSSTLLSSATLSLSTPVIVTTTSFSSTVSTEQSSPPESAPPVSSGNNGWIAAPVVCGILLVAVLTAIAVFLFIRHRRKRKSTNLAKGRREDLALAGIQNPSFRLDSEDSDRPPPCPVRVEDFVAHVAELHKDSDYGFASEFSTLGKISPQHPKTAAEFPENRTKNRFTNVLPFDHTRVRLIPVDDEENGGSDYINASFLPGFSSRREFIAAQGPMKSTVDDFWRMVWEYNVTTIVMVTNLFERGREKCAQYWPDLHDPIYYGEVQVDLKSESLVNYYVIRDFTVTLDQKSRRVTHYQFLTWPDFGVPKEHDHLLAFLTEIRNRLGPTSNQPIVIHCSAGVGRTGTFILIDHVLQMMRHQPCIDVFSLVLDMRNHRQHMIQTEAQYIFAHECIKYAIEHDYHKGKNLDFTNIDDTIDFMDKQNERVDA